MKELKHRSYVPETTDMKEFTFRAVLLGLVMTVILGAANAYLGLKAGMTIAATYPAAVIAMAVLRIFRGSILEENMARTVGSIGESVAAGAIFTIPAFVMSGSWQNFQSFEAYWKSTVLMLVGGALGILFVTLLRRVMVNDPDLPYPESVAASEIHKAGQQGSAAAKLLFQNMGLGALIYFLGELRLFAATKEFVLHIGEVGRSVVKLGTGADAPVVQAGGVSTIAAPAVSPAYLGVGYIIGPRLAALNFSGSLLAWGLMVPLLIYFLGPQLRTSLPAGSGEEALAPLIYRFIVRPIAVGGMLVGAAYTLFKMRKNLAIGLSRAVRREEGRRATASHQPHRSRSEHQDRVPRPRRGVPLHDRPIHVSVGHTARRSGCGDRDDHPRVLLRRRFRQPRGHDRLVEQPDLRPDAVNPDRGCAPDGEHRRRRKGISLVYFYRHRFHPQEHELCRP
jgi:putative OPT family oligopeptide transporter